MPLLKRLMSVPDALQVVGVAYTQCRIVDRVRGAGRRDLLDRGISTPSDNVPTSSRTGMTTQVFSPAFRGRFPHPVVSGIIVSRAARVAPALARESE